MTELELETKGLYEPGFFHIRLNTDGNIFDLNHLANNPETRPLFATFFHEYIHFLQDITTTSGIIQSGRYINMIKDFNWGVRKSTSSEFTVPFTVTNEYNTEVNLELRKIARGNDIEREMVFYENYITEVAEVIDNDGNVKKPKQFRVFFTNSSSYISESFYFGSLCLKEYITHTLQKKYLPEVDHPDIPYKIVEQIVQKECPKFVQDPILILALCDACLMSFHPAEIFFFILNKINSETFIPETIDELYEFVYNAFKFIDNEELLNVEALFDKALGFTESQIEDALQGNIFRLNLQWLKHILLEGRALRFGVPIFMTALVDGPYQLSAFCSFIFKKIGTPFFSNKNFAGGFVSPEDLKEIPDQPYLLLVFREILNVYAGNRHCGLFQFCKQHPVADITNIKCTNAPWERVKEPFLCPFAQLWQTWGLSGKVPIQRISGHPSPGSV